MLNFLAQTSFESGEVVYTTTQVDTGGFAFFGGAWLFFWLVVWVLSIVAMWKIFEKAGEPGWKSIIPIYSAYELCRIAGRNGLWVLGLLVPFVNLIIWLVIAIDLAKHFGKDTVYGVVALWLFAIVGFLMLGFGDAKYVGPKHA